MPSTGILDLGTRTNHTIQPIQKYLYIRFKKRNNWLPKIDEINVRYLVPNYLPRITFFNALVKNWKIDADRFQKCRNSKFFKDLFSTRTYTDTSKGHLIWTITHILDKNRLNTDESRQEIVFPAIFQVYWSSLEIFN